MPVSASARLWENGLSGPWRRIKLKHEARRRAQALITPTETETMSAANTIVFNDQPLKDDLNGSLQGSVLCAQSTIVPSRASALPDDVQPRLVAQRDTLVMFKPLGSETLPFVTLQVVAADGALLYSAPMDPPSAMPQAPDNVTSGGKKIIYGEPFWSYRLPWACIVPGIRLLFGSAFRSGYYHDVDVGASSELVLHTIDVGMLTPPQDVFNPTFTADIQRQFFQQWPLSRLVVNRYEPVHMKEVMLSDGTLYTERSTANETADAYHGDMRNQIGKDLVAEGINHANLGIHSSPGSGSGGLTQHFVAAQVAAHSSVGMYTEGRVVHGGGTSGGLVCSSDCKGSPFSGLVGMAMGVRNTNTFNTSVHRPAGSINSTWGWDSEKNVFLPNFDPAETNEVRNYDGECQEPFHGHRFGIDPWAGGFALNPTVNRYAMWTPNVLNQLQGLFENKVVFDKASKSGYSRWNENTRSMEPWAEFKLVNPTEVKLDEPGMRDLIAKYRLLEVSMWNQYYTRDAWMPAASAENKGRGVRFVHQATFEASLHINGEVLTLADGVVLNFESNGSKWQPVDDFSFNVAREPETLGVPVTTIVGLYDPQGKLRDYFYSALHGGYGNVFKPDRAMQTKIAKCWVEVSNAKGQTRGYVLRSVRAASKVMNRVHINVPQSFGATSVTLYRDGKAVLTQALAKPAGGSGVTIHGCA